MSVGAKETSMTSANGSTPGTSVYTVYIRATPEAIFDAITNPDQTEKWGYGGRAEYDLRPGGVYRAHSSEAMTAMGMPEVAVDGEVLEADLPNRLVQTWNPLFGPPITDEPATTLTYEAEASGYAGVTKLTLTHVADGAPLTAGLTTGAEPMSGGGFPFVVSDLKSFLETGSSFAGS
jgi:uncharacterized protein YndB with AHSA1/START domain